MATYHVAVNCAPTKCRTYAEACALYELCRRAGAYVSLASKTELIRRYWPTRDGRVWNPERRGRLGQMPAVQT